MYRVWNFLTEYSLLLILGAVIALAWANLDYESYHHSSKCRSGTMPRLAICMMGTGL